MVVYRTGLISVRTKTMGAYIGNVYIYVLLFLLKIPNYQRSSWYQDPNHLK